MKKLASILDFIYPGLDPYVWAEDGTLLPEHKGLILRTLQSHLEADGLKDTNKWIEQVKIIGGMTTYRYTFDSDVDVHIKVDLQAFIDANKPNMTEQEAHAYLDDLRKKINKTVVNLNNTKHPIEYYFETPFVNKEGSPGSGVYDVQSDEWVVPPVSINKDFDIEEIHKVTVNIANEMADEIEIGLGRMDRHIRRIEELQKVIPAWDDDQQKKFKLKLQTKLQEIEIEIKKNVDLLEKTVQERRKYDPEGDAEIKFKYLQKFGYLAVINELKKFIEDDGRITEDEIPEIKKVLDEAGLGLSKIDKEADATGFWIDPNGKEYDVDDMEDHESWVLDHNLEGMTEIIRDGWVRVRMYGPSLAIELNDLKKIPKYLDNFLSPIFYDTIVLENITRDTTVTVTKDDVDANGLQKAVNKALQLNRLQLANLGLSKIDKESGSTGKYLADEDWELANKKVNADFSPSISTHAPTNKWNPDSDQEIPLDPDSMSDETTWENGEHADKPRKGFWKKVLDMILTNVDSTSKEATVTTNYDYSCAMLEIPGNIASKVWEWGEENIPEEDIYEGTGDEADQFGREDEAHVTVLYGLHTNDVEEIKKLFKDKVSPTIKLGKVSHFSPEDKPYDVVVINIESKDLHDLNKLLTDNLEYTTDFPEYNPHMTIAYVKKGKAKQYDGQTINEGKEIKLEKIIFSPAEGDKSTFELNKQASPPSNQDYHKQHIKPLGVTEFLEFYNVAPPDVQEEVDALLEEDKTQEAWVLMEKYLGRSHLKLSKDQPNKPNTTWDDPNQDGEPFSPLPTTFQKDINEKNLNWRYPWKYMGKPKGPNYSNEGEIVKFLEDMPLSKTDKKATTEVPIGYDRNTRVYENLTKNQVLNLFKNSANELRWFKAPDDKLFIWDAYDLTHDMAISYLGYEVYPGTDDYDNRTGTFTSANDISMFFSGDLWDKNDKKASGSFRAWIDPNGEIFKLDDSQREMHGDWIMDHKETLEKDYGLNFGNMNPWETIYYVLDNGWTRIHGGHRRHEWNIMVKNIHSLPSGAEALSSYLEENDTIFVETSGGGDSVRIEQYNTEDKLQHQINKALQQKILVPAKKQSSTYTSDEMEQIYMDQHEQLDDPGQGGGYTPRDFNNSTTDFPKPEDLERPKVYLDRMDDTTTPPIASYEVTWFIGTPRGN